MQVVATLNGKFFRAQSATEEEVEVIKQTMLQDQEELEFEVMTNAEFEQWLKEMGA